MTNLHCFLFVTTIVCLPIGYIYKLDVDGFEFKRVTEFITLKRRRYNKIVNDSKTTKTKNSNLKFMLLDVIF